MLKGAAAGFISGIVSNTNPFKAALWGAVTAGAAWGVGHGIGGGLWKNGHGFFSEGSIGRNLVHGVAQGTISELRGGNFKSGFVGAVVGGIGGSASGKVMGALGTSSNVFSRTMVAAVFGGLASEATGGSFEDGALSAAFTHLFNYEASLPKCSAYTDGACIMGEKQVDTRAYPGSRMAGWAAAFDGEFNGREPLTVQEAAKRLGMAGTVIGVGSILLLSGPEGWAVVGVVLGDTSMGMAGLAFVFDPTKENFAGAIAGPMGKYAVGPLFGQVAEQTLGGYSTLYGVADLVH